MKLLNASEIDWGGITIKMRRVEIGKIQNWDPSTKKYNHVYELKSTTNYQNYLPVKSTWTLAIKKRGD